MTNDALQELAMKCSMAVDTDFENMADTLAAVSVKLRALSADRGEAVAWRLVQPSLGEFGVRPWRDMPAPPAEALAEWAKHGERIEYAYAATPSSPAESAAPCSRCDGSGYGPTGEHGTCNRCDASGAAPSGVSDAVMALPAKWRNAADVLDDIDPYRDQRAMARAECYRSCADQLEAVLPLAGEAQ